MFGRRNVLKENILAFFFAFSSYPRLLLEVFIRKNLGERYFSYMTGITLIVLLSVWPLMMEGVINVLTHKPFEFGHFFLHYTTWYLFLYFFWDSCKERNEEIKRLPSVFDFGRYSLSTGERHPRILDFKWKGKHVDIRTTETLVEPALFFFLGLFLAVVGQVVGVLLIICSIFYSLSYMAAYAMGDHFIMDKIDEMIINEEMVASFVEDKDPSETRGVSFYGRKPSDPETRRKLADMFIEDYEEAVVAQ